MNPHSEKLLSKLKQWRVLNYFEETRTSETSNFLVFHNICCILIWVLLNYRHEKQIPSFKFKLCSPPKQLLCKEMGKKKIQNSPKELNCKAKQQINFKIDMSYSVNMWCWMLGCADCCEYPISDSKSLNCSKKPTSISNFIL